MSLFIPITKVDVAQRLVYGTLSEEIADKAGEILDYAGSKPEFEKWSRGLSDASGGKNLGNVWAMHGSVAAGKFVDIAFDDKNKRISGVAKIVDDDEWQKVLEGVYTGFSIGGGYAKRWNDSKNPALMRYIPILSEVSLVDNPAVPTATFEVVKQDGSVEMRKFTLGKIEADSELLKTISVLQERIAVLENRPLLAKGNLRAVSKSEDRSGIKLGNKMPDNDINAIMKAALANPIIDFFPNSTIFGV
ncbi:MAG: hypothetical protein WCL30_05955 [Pseudomonadota bacterium]